MSLLENLKKIENKPYTPIFSGRLISYCESRCETNKNHFKSISRLSESKLFDEKNDDKLEYESETSTNLSLFSLYSNELKRKIEYGRIGHFSPFERFTNRRSKKSLKNYIYLIESKLHQYLKFIKKNVIEDDYLEPNLFELLEKDEITCLQLLLKYNKIKALKMKSKSTPEIRNINMNKPQFKNSTFSKNISELRRRRHSIAIGEYFELLNCNRLINENIKTNLDANTKSNKKLSMNPQTFLQNLKEPVVYKPYLNKLNKQKTSTKNMFQKQISNERYYLNNNYNGIKSKIKSYIKSNRNYTNNKYNNLNKYETNLNYMKLTQNVKEFEPEKLKICSQLVKTIQKDLKLNKGPVYFATLTKESLETLNNSKIFSQADKYLYIYEWLQNLQKEFLQEKIINVGNSDSIDISMLTNIASDNIIESVSNINTNSFYTDNFVSQSKSPNIYLPKFIFNNKPISEPEKSNNQSLNDSFVLKLMKEYRRNKLKNKLSYKASISIDSMNNNYLKLTDSWLKVQNVNEKLILREKLSNARLENELLRARIKLDLFIL